MDSSSESESELICSTPPPELLEAQAGGNLEEISTFDYVNDSQMPEKSKNQYNAMYDNFISWTMEKHLGFIDEDVLISFFEEKGKKYKPPTLFSMYSMLKCTLISRNNINLKEYSKLQALLKRVSKGYKSKKSRVFTAEDIRNFLQNAPDYRYLGVKVVLILGVNGACRSQELIDLTIDDIEIHGNVMLVKIPDVKTKRQRSFAICDESFDIMKKYKDLRPNDVPTRRFLLQYRNDKIVKQVIGRNNIGAMPKAIAKFLNLPNPEEYTGHCFRRTAAKLSSHDGWKYNRVPQGYCLENSQVPPSAGGQSPQGQANGYFTNETSIPTWAVELEQRRVAAAERQMAATERQAAASERCAERQGAAVEMLCVRLAAAAEQQSAALVTISQQLDYIKHATTRH